MRLLADTHQWLWFQQGSSRLHRTAKAWMLDPANDVYFSVVSIWEMAIKFSLARPDFLINATLLRSDLLRQGFKELLITGEHAAAVANLPLLHGDPFDRLLIAQANVEGLTLVTSDEKVARYPGVILK